MKEKTSLINYKAAVNAITDIRGCNILSNLASNPFIYPMRKCSRMPIDIHTLMSKSEVLLYGNIACNFSLRAVRLVYREST